MQDIFSKRSIRAYPARLIDPKKLTSTKDVPKKGSIGKQRWKTEKVSIYDEGFQASCVFVLERKPKKIETFERTVKLVFTDQFGFLIDIPKKMIWLTDSSPLKKKTKERILEIIPRLFKLRGSVPIEINLPELVEIVKERNILVHQTHFRGDDIQLTIQAPYTRFTAYYEEFSAFIREMTRIDISWPADKRIRISVRKDNLRFTGLEHENTLELIVFLGKVIEMLPATYYRPLDDFLAPNLGD